MLKTDAPSRPASVDELLDPRLVARLHRVDLASKKVFAGKMKGERRSKRRGESVEFADHRPYAVGDDLRFIDWNIYGRLDRLFMKLFLEEEDLSLHLVLDCSASMNCGDPEKFAWARRAAAALGDVGLFDMNRVAVSRLGGRNAGDPDNTDADARPADAATLRDLRGRRRVHDLGRFLCSTEPGGDDAFAQNARRIALARRGKGVMVVLSDFLFKDGYERGLRYLLGRGYDLVLIQVLSPDELNPPLGGDLRLRDLEDGERVEITVSAPLLKRYRERLAAFTGGLRDFCARREITLLTLSSDTPIDDLLLGYLRERGVLR